MNDAGRKYSTPVARLRDLVTDGQYTPAQALRQFGPPDLVAEMDRQIEIETARLFPPPPSPVPRGQTPWDKYVTQLIRQYPDEPEKVTAELNRIAAIPDRRQEEMNIELHKLWAQSALQGVISEIWAGLKTEGVQGRLLFSFQPTEPTARREILPADRIPYLQCKGPQTLLEGPLGMAFQCLVKNPRPDTWWFDWHELRYARIARAALPDDGSLHQIKPMPEIAPAASSASGKPTNDAVLSWLTAYYVDNPRAKQTSVKIDCISAIGATHGQMRRALNQIQGRRRRGERDRTR
jgi:hypothetical protein